ncbi:MAG: NADH-quinone oxidoreductase subunit NuoF [Planctomycetota bacterium]
MEYKIVSKLFDIPGVNKLEVYVENGGYGSLKKLFSMKPEEVIEEVKSSGLRGRGGAGFSAGLKWSFIPKNVFPRYLCINADEGEPGTFKDRLIIGRVPHQLIEGAIITSYAIRANIAYIYIRPEFHSEINVIDEAIKEAYRKNYLGKNIIGTDFSLDVIIHIGGGPYIAGEETGLIESIEGKKAYPRNKPPYFPAVIGLYNKPTIVNNVETIATLPAILNHGAQWYRSIGTEKSPGTRLFSISGAVKKPGVYEAPLNITLKNLIFDYAGGFLDNRKILAIIPGGLSSPPLSLQEAENTTMTFEDLAAKNSMAGSGAVIVIDDSICILKVIHRLALFYARESCGQCTPCREGTKLIADGIEKIEKGITDEQIVKFLHEIAEAMVGKTICVLADAQALPVIKFLKMFKNDIEQHIKLKKCPYES